MFHISSSLQSSIVSPTWIIKLCNNRFNFINFLHCYFIKIHSIDQRLKMMFILTNKAKIMIAWKSWSGILCKEENIKFWCKRHTTSMLCLKNYKSLTIHKFKWLGNGSFWNLITFKDIDLNCFGLSPFIYDCQNCFIPVKINNWLL